MDWKEIENEPTESLIEFIQSKEDNDYIELSKAAFKAFTFRFRGELLDKCVVICRKWGMDEHDAGEVAHFTFDRFWKYPKFKKSKCNTKDIDQCVLFYLFGIAKRVLADYYNNIPSPYTGDEEIITSLTANNDLEPERKAKLEEVEKVINKALSYLTDKHKIIFLTYYVHSKDGYKLPRELTKHLRERLMITQNTIRVYKKEANEAFEKYLSNDKK